jgi:hypothetical protein
MVNVPRKAGRKGSTAVLIDHVSFIAFQASDKGDSLAAHGEGGSGVTINVADIRADDGETEDFGIGWL